MHILDIFNQINVGDHILFSFNSTERLKGTVACKHEIFLKYLVYGEDKKLYHVDHIQIICKITNKIKLV